MRKVYVIGAGQLGSRHLQAMRQVETPLAITVIDPSQASLATAKERYESIPPGPHAHSVRYATEIPAADGDIDIAIVPTSSNARRAAIEAVLSGNRVRYFLLEKLLFQDRGDYAAVAELLEKTGSRAWVNCCMRMMPFYQGLKGRVPETFEYAVSGSNYGLVTNAIHYIDHMAYLAGDAHYGVDATYLDPVPIQSKRNGFLELNGTLQVRFRNGSLGRFSCFPGGTAPVTVEISSPTFRCISIESEGRALVSEAGTNWQWREEEARILYQSQMTRTLVEGLLADGRCPLPQFRESAEIHLHLHDGLMAFLQEKCGMNPGRLPFT